MTSFAIPGDSGALVLDSKTGWVVGVVSMIELVKDSGAVTIVKPIWEFYDFRSEEAVDVIYSVAKLRSGSNFCDDQGHGNLALLGTSKRNAVVVNVICLILSFFRIFLRHENHYFGN